MALDYLRAALALCPCRCASPGALLLLIQLANYAARDGVAYPSHDTLLRRCRRSRIRDLREEIQRLTQAGVLTYWPGRGRSSSRYVLHLPALLSHSDGTPADQPCPFKAQATYIQRGLNEHGLNQPVLKREAQPVLVEPPQPVLNEHPDPVFDPGSQPPPPPTPPAQPNRPDQSAQDAGEEGGEEEFQSPEKGRRKARQNSAEVLTQAWQQRRDAAGNKLQSSLSRSDWQSWCQAFDESGATPAQARTVGEWIAKDGMSWVKLPKLRYLVSHWERCLTQALEWHAGRGPTRAAGIDAAESARDVVRQARGKAVPPPPEALEKLQGLGLGGLFKRSDGDTP